MGKLSVVKEIREAAKGLLSKNPGGMRFKQIVKTIHHENPQFNFNTVFTVVSNLHKDLPGEIVKPSRGLFQLAGAPIPGGETDDPVVIAPNQKKVYEHEFYPSFAEWLKNDLDEVTDVAPLGGAGLKSKWGTPDVVGVYKPQAANLGLLVVLSFVSIFVRPSEQSKYASPRTGVAMMISIGTVGQTPTARLRCAPSGPATPRSAIVWSFVICFITPPRTR